MEHTEILKAGRLVLRMIYAPMKLRRSRKKITMISRQSNEPTVDIALLEDFLRKERPDIDVRVLCRKLEGGSKMAYGLHMLSQMWHIADSSIVLLDGYCIAASILDHKKETRIIQMWHSLAAIKKFGYQTLDRPGGRSSKIAEALCMHRNYDYVLAPSRATGEFFCQAFNTDMSKLVYLGLPRIDLIKKDSGGTGLRKAQGIGESKTLLLYAPTFRKSSGLAVADLIKAIEPEKYHLVICPHPLDDCSGWDWDGTGAAHVTLDRMESTYSWLAECDGVITDYSALSVEAAIADKPVYFYVNDIEEYERTEGINVDPRKEMPRVTAQNAMELAAVLEEPYPIEEIKKFRSRYVSVNSDNCTGSLCDFISELI